MTRMNTMAPYKDKAIKQAMYDRAVAQNDVAYKEIPTAPHRWDLAPVKLADCPIDTVDFVGGLWRIQNEFDYEIKNIRGCDMVIGARRPESEKNGFEYYDGYSIFENCYGRALGNKFIVGHTTTGRGECWAYGKTISDVRAYLAIALYDMYMDVIHGTTNQTKTR